MAAHAPLGAVDSCVMILDSGFILIFCGCAKQCPLVHRKKDSNTAKLKSLIAMFFYFSFMEPPEPLAIDPTFDTHIWQEHGIQKRTKSIRNPEKAHDMYGSSRSTRSVGVNICLMG